MALVRPRWASLDDELDAVQPTVTQRTQERGPEVLGLAVADVDTEHRTVPVSGDTGGDHDCLGHDPAADAGLAVGRVEEHIRGRLGTGDRVRARRRCRRCRAGPQMRLTSDLGDPGLDTEGGDQVVDTCGSGPLRSQGLLFAMITACSATSTRRRGQSSDGKNDPERTFGILTVMSPVAVATSLSRVPLRWFVRASLRSCGSAPMNAAPPRRLVGAASRPAAGASDHHHRRFASHRAG